MDDVEERAKPVDLVKLARQRRGEIEAEAVNVHLQHPVAQAVHDELQGARMRHVQGVAAAREVHVVTLVVGHEAIVSRVINAAKAERRPQVIAFARVVVDDIENHFDAFAMQRLHHRLELGDLLAETTAIRVAHIGREETNRVVAPVIRQAAICQVFARNELMDGQEFNCRDVEPT